MLAGSGILMKYTPQFNKLLLNKQDTSFDSLIFMSYQ